MLMHLKEFTKSLPIGPALWINATIQAGLAVVLSFTPLFDVLGYEFCVAMSLLVSMLSGPLGIFVVRHSKSNRSWAYLWLTAMVESWIVSIPALMVISLNAFRVQNCNFLQGAILFLLLPLATSSICSGWGVAAGIVIRRRFLAGAAYYALWVVVAGINILQAWSGPQILSYNQLAGWIAGPIYDDVIEPGIPLIMSRLMGLCMALVLVVSASWIGRRSRLRIRGRETWTSAISIAALGMSVALWIYSGELGFGRQGYMIERLLPGVTRTEHFVIHHPKGLDSKSRKTLALEHEFCLHQIKLLLGEHQLRPIDSWVFSDFSQKRKLLGAGRTQYTKPWQAAIYINGTSVPHPTLKHELVHAYASSFGAGPLAVSANHGIFINPGLTEGLAVAVDWPHSGRFSPHTWSAALKKIGKLPAIESLFDPIGFWTASASRSYTVAGSFIRFLLDTYGAEKLKRAYAAGTLDGFYPVTTTGLIKKWEQFLETINLAPGIEELARSRFSGKSVFDRTCAHEIAALRSRAEAYASNNQFEKARETFTEILRHIPSDISSRQALMAIDRAEQKTNKAIADAEQLISLKNLSSAAKTRLLSKMSDFMRSLGKSDRASELQLQVLDAHLSDASDRTAIIKLQAMHHPETSKPIFDLLDTGRLTALVLLDLRETTVKEPLWAETWYLLGRQLFNMKRYRRALEYLWHAGMLGLGHPSLCAENLRLIALSLYYTMFDDKPLADSTDEKKPATDDSTGRAFAIFTVMAQFPRHEGELLFAKEWIQRLCYYNDHNRF